jgi:surface antigen
MSAVPTTRRSIASTKARTLRIENLETRAMLAASPAASFVSKSVADHAVVDADSAFTQNLTFTNSGNTTWSGYNLVLLSSGDHLGAPTSVPISTTPPGGKVTVSVPLQAVPTYSGEGASQLAFWNIKTASNAIVPISGISYTNSNRVAANRVWTSITINPTSGPDLSTPEYTDGPGITNPYVPEGNGGECVAYVWGRAYELTGTKLSWQANAGQPWITDAKAAGYQVNMTPTSNSIAVWTNPRTGLGHVAYVEGVVPGATAATTIVSITESNYADYMDFAAVNDPNNARNASALIPHWGGGYDGPPEAFTQTQMLTHNYPQYKLLGYIHLPTVSGAAASSGVAAATVINVSASGISQTSPTSASGSGAANVVVPQPAAAVPPADAAAKNAQAVDAHFAQTYVKPRWSSRG